MKMEMDSQSGKLDWPKSTVLQLVDLWSENECLYQPRHPLYHNKKARFVALNEIANQLRGNIQANDVKVKINYLRGQYSRELIKIQEGCRSDLDYEEESAYQPSAYWFEKMSFIRDFVHKKRSGIQKKIVKRSPPSRSAKRIRSAYKPLKHEQAYRSQDNTPSPSKVAPSAVLATPSLQPQTIAIASAYSIIKTDIEAFGNHIKEEMSKITNEELQDELQHKIQNLLYEYKTRQRLLNK